MIYALEREAGLPFQRLPNLGARQITHRGDGIDLGERLDLWPTRTPRIPRPARGSPTRPAAEAARQESLRNAALASRPDPRPTSIPTTTSIPTDYDPGSTTTSSRSDASFLPVEASQRPAAQDGAGGAQRRGDQGARPGPHERSRGRGLHRRAGPPAAGPVRPSTSSAAPILAKRFELPMPMSIEWAENQRRRWGSCQPSSGRIRISAQLTECPPWVLDYVIVHELTHLGTQTTPRLAAGRPPSSSRAGLAAGQGRAHASPDSHRSTSTSTWTSTSGPTSSSSPMRPRAGPNTEVIDEALAFLDRARASSRREALDLNGQGQLLG